MGLARGMGALVIKDVAMAANPLLIGAAVDALTQGRGVRRVAAIAGLLLAVAVVKGIFQYFMRVILIGISRDIEYDLRNDLFRHLVSLSPEYYGRTRTGDIMARATNDLNAVRMMLGPGIMYWTETSLTFTLAIVIMLSIDWQFTILALLPAPLVSVAVMVVGRRIHERFEKIQAMFSDISSRVQENLAGVRMVRAFAQERAEMKRFETINRAYIAENLRLVRLSPQFQPALEALIGLTFLIVLWAGGYRVLTGKISVGTFVTFNTYMGTLVWPMIALGWVINLMQRGTASLSRIEEILRERPAISAPPEPAAPARIHGEIELCDVTVDYGSVKALDGVRLRIDAGSTVAIVGHTGSGKSTLAGLIPRLLDPTSGAVLVDGMDIRQHDPAELRRSIGFVPQETFLFSTTVAGNIAFGVDGSADEQIREAAEMAGLAGDIEGFPERFQTMVGERGITLSGGQKQRAAIARALMRNPAILILDDALSSVDTLTEERILTGLQKIMSGRTVILISHRVSTVRGADQIVVLERGRIVEQGTHAELTAAGGYYADLAQKQMLEEELEAI
jgi:ATP-binding cassette subfamily B protein